MTEAGNTDTDAGKRYPFINLEKAVGRAKELFDADQKGREMSNAAAFAVWNYSTKSSGGFQTIAALKMYGLIGSASGGKLALDEAALRYFRDEREEEKKKLLQGFALKPRLIAALWSNWHDAPPADTIARSHLKAERGLTDQAARGLLAIYKDNLAFAELTGGATIPNADLKTQHGTPPFQAKVKVGDYIQWVSGGVDMFAPPRQVEWVSPDGQYLRVFGSPTGIPMSEATIAPTPGAAPTASVQAHIANEPGSKAEPSKSKPNITVYQVGGRLQITADIDAEGIQKLRDMLNKYEEILKLLN